MEAIIRFFFLRQRRLSILREALPIKSTFHFHFTRPFVHEASPCILVISFQGVLCLEFVLNKHLQVPGPYFYLSKTR